MNGERLFRILGWVDEDLIEEADTASSPAASIARLPAESSVRRGTNCSAPPAGNAARRRISAPYSVSRTTPPQAMISSFTRSKRGYVQGTSHSVHRLMVLMPTAARASLAPLV